MRRTPQHSTRATGRTAGLPARLLAGLVVLACLALGIIGLILPIIPGVLFLAIAVLVGARYFPWVAARLKEHGRVGSLLDRSERALDLPLGAQLRLAGLVCLKGVLDGLRFVGGAAAKLLAGRGTRPSIGAR